MNVSRVSSPATAIAQNAAEEARETAAQTRAEATKGDQQAMRKVAQQDTVNRAENTAVKDLFNVKA